MALFRKRGTRIRKFHQKMKWITYFVICSPFLLSVGAYCWFYYEQILSEPIVYASVALLLIIVSIVLSIFINHYLYLHNSFFQRLDAYRVMSNFLLENKFYSSKRVNDKEKIKLPKVYIKYEKYGLEAFFILQGNRFQDKFLNIAKDLEVMFDGDFIQKNFTKGFVSYIIVLGSIRGRIDVRDVEVTKQGLKLMEDVYWDYNEQPHLLLAGGTGGGKTVTLMTIIYGLAKVGWVDICDPKKSDFVGLKDVPVFHNRVFWTKEEMVACLRDNVEFMNQRYLEMTNHPEYRAGKRYSDYGMKPKFIAFDEWAAFQSELASDYKMEAEVRELLTQIVLKGRQSGVFIILAMQRPDGEYIKTSLRDNFMKRLSVGHLEDMGYSMMYGEANSKKEFKTIKEINGVKVYGRGYIANGGEIAREFFSPSVPFAEGFSFLDEFEKIPVIPFEDEAMKVFNESGTQVETKTKKDDLDEIRRKFEEDEAFYAQFSDTYNDPIEDRKEEEMDLPKVEGYRYINEFSKDVGYTFSQIYKLIVLLEKKGYCLFRKDEHVYTQDGINRRAGETGNFYLLSPEDESLLVELLDLKLNSILTWKELVDVYYSEGSDGVKSRGTKEKKVKKEPPKIEGFRNIKDLSKESGYSLSQIYKLITLIEEKEYRSFRKEDSYYLLTPEDEKLLIELFELKSESSMTWKEQVDEFFR